MPISSKRLLASARRWPAATSRTTIPRCDAGHPPGQTAAESYHQNPASLIRRGRESFDWSRRGDFAVCLHWGSSRSRAFPVERCRKSLHRYFTSIPSGRYLTIGRSMARAAGWGATRAARGNLRRGGDRRLQSTARPIVIDTLHCGTPCESVTPGCGCLTADCLDIPRAPRTESGHPCCLAVTVNLPRMPSPTMPGLHAVAYVPGSDTFTLIVREVPGPMPSTSLTTFRSGP